MAVRGLRRQGTPIGDDDPMLAGVAQRDSPAPIAAARRHRTIIDQDPGDRETRGQADGDRVPSGRGHVIAGLEPMDIGLDPDREVVTHGSRVRRFGRCRRGEVKQQSDDDRE